MNDDSGQVAQVIGEILGFLNVVAVISIDDIYALDDVENSLAVAVGWLARAKDNGAAAGCSRILEGALGESDFLAADDEVWKRRLGERRASLQRDMRRQLLHSVAKLIDEDVDVEHDLRSASLLRGAIPPAMEFREMRPSEWDAQCRDVLPKGPNDGLVLCLFDHNLQCDDSCRTSDGLQLLAAALQTREDHPLLCALLTHTVSRGEEIERAAELARRIGRRRKDFLVLSKSRLADGADFADGLKMVSLNYVRDVLSNKTKDLADAASTRANEDLMDLDILDFEYMVLETSEQEGLWEADTLFRLFDVFRRRAFLESAFDSGTKGALDAEIERLRTIRHVRTISDVVHPPRRQRWVLRRLDLYDSGAFLRQGHLPLELGDIFQIRSMKFVLLAQPCDLMVRANGCRAADTVTLVKITSNASQYSFRLEYFHERTGASAYAQFRSSYPISADVLDLAVFDDDGECHLDISTAPSPMLHMPWRKRFERVHRRFSKHSRKLDQLCAALGSVHLSQDLATHLRRSLVGSITGCRLRVPCEYRDGVFSFGVKRIGRYREPYASRLLTSYSSFLARYAEPPDYTPPEEVAPGVTRLPANAMMPSQGYVGSEKGRKYHRPDCRHATEMRARAGVLYFEDRTRAEALGRGPCAVCRP